MQSGRYGSRQRADPAPLGSKRERASGSYTAAQCPCRHPTNTLPIVSAACSRLCKHPPPRRSGEAIFRPTAGSDFMCNVRLSLPLSGGWTFPAASQTKGERWMEGRRAGPGRRRQENNIVSSIYWLHFSIILVKVQCNAKKFFSPCLTVSLDRESAAASRFMDSFFFFQHIQNRRQFGAATWIDVHVFGTVGGSHMTWLTQGELCTTCPRKAYFGHFEHRKINTDSSLSFRKKKRRNISTVQSC